jgi:Protein of unknown function (DUF3073)
MGRGRAKAKQTKVARDLKYRTHETDFGALARELHGDSDSGTDSDADDDVEADGADDSAEEYDDWSGYAEQSRD